MSATITVQEELLTFQAAAESQWSVTDYAYALNHI